MRSRALLLLSLLLSAAPLFSQQPARPAITGIAFIRLYTTDAPAAQHFYSDTLGFTRRSVAATVLYPVNDLQWIELLPNTPPPDALHRLAAVGFTTRDAAGLQRYLQSRHVAIDQPLHAGSFSVLDPEGNRIVFVQTGPSGPEATAVATTPPTPAAPSHRIIHVGFSVVDPAKEDAFYKEILGFRPNWHGGRDPQRTDWVSIQVPDGVDWLEYMLNPNPTPTRREFGSKDHVSLGVEHMSDAVAALARNGCTDASCSKTQMGRDGKVQLNLFDPDQTRVEYMEFKPTGQTCCSPILGKLPGPTEVR